VVVGGLLIAAAAPPSVTMLQASHLKEFPKKHRILYQLDEEGVDRARFVLRNIRNHVDGVGGWDHIEALELVVFGPALRVFVAKDMDREMKQALAELQSQGLRFGACGNTMRGMNVSLDQLAPGAIPLPQGGVVRLMELQEQGYTYIRP
jgi:intracellular sulfur oxidation DsrE/DsrF family protein